MEKEVKSEADIEYEQQCPIEKYAIAKGGEYLVDADCQVTYADGTPTPEFDKDARIYLENILDKSHPLWQAGARYQATYAYVLSPLTDEIRLVPSNRSAILFKNILTESEMAYAQHSMKQGETLHYALILANVYKRGIQKVEFTIHYRGRPKKKEHTTSAALFLMESRRSIFTRVKDYRTACSSTVQPLLMENLQ